MARVLPILLLAPVLACTAPPDPPAADLPEPFTLAVLPDVQYLSLDYPAVLDSVTEWTAAVADARGIAWLLQEGDITHNNTQDEWDNAAHAFSLLDDVPYTVCVGNHDIGADGDTSLFNAAFPVSDLPAESLGTYEPDKLDNHWLTFHAGGVSWLVLSLVYDPDDDVLAWADTIIASHPTHRVIVLTHAYLGPTGTRTGIGERIWEQALRAHPNVTLVFNGHYLGSTAAHLVSTGDEGNAVAQIFANYQDEPLGGAGTTRLVEVDTVQDRLSVTTYSPFLDVTFDDEANAFTLDLPLGPLKTALP